MHLPKTKIIDIVAISSSSSYELEELCPIIDSVGSDGTQCQALCEIIFNPVNSVKDFSDFGQTGINV